MKTKKSASKSNMSSAKMNMVKSQEYFDHVKEHLTSLMDYSISGTKAFNKCEVLLYPEDGGLFVVEGKREGDQWKQLSIKDIQSEIIKALHLGDVAKFKDLASRMNMRALQAPIECTRKTLLHTAAEKGHVEIAELLLQWGFPVDIIVAKQAMTPLHAAIIWDSPEMERFLIENGASLNAKFKHHTAKELQNLKATLNDRSKIYSMFEDQLNALLDEASHYHFHTRIFSMARRRLGELKSAKHVREQAKQKWAAKQQKKVQVYQEELDQAVAAYDREQHQQEAKASQEAKMKLQAKSYYKNLQQGKVRANKHSKIQENSRAAAAKVIQDRKKNPTNEDPFDWLKNNDGMVKSKLSSRN